MKRPKRAAQPVPSVSLPGEAGSISWWIHGVIVAGLLAMSIALYAGSLKVGFLSLDDPDYIQNNPFISSLSPANLRHILSTPYLANYAPGHLLSYAVDVSFAGKDPWALHFSSLIWYA